jgi:hypothetical protein
VYLDGKKIKDIKSFESYVDKYFKPGSEIEKFYERCGERWEVCIAIIPD